MTALDRRERIAVGFWVVASIVVWNGLYDLLLALSVIEGPKTLILMSEGLILDTPSDLDAIIRAAAMARVTINVLLMDVPRDDITVGQLGPTVTEDRDMAVSGLADLAPDDVA